MSSHRTERERGLRGGRPVPDEAPGLDGTAHESRAHLGEDDRGEAAADEWIGYGGRPFAETKPFFATSEFLAMLGTIVAVAIAMAVSDSLDGRIGWPLIAGLACFYMLSRGLAKSGTGDPNPVWFDRPTSGRRGR